VPTPQTASTVLDREFLEIRAKLLELAASFDRIDRGEGDVQADPRMRQIRQAIQVIAGSDADRAARLQLVFSLPYDTHWRDQFGIT
jgi:hypothetical protein